MPEEESSLRTETTSPKEVHRLVVDSSSSNWVEENEELERVILWLYGGTGLTHFNEPPRDSQGCDRLISR